MTDAEVAQSTQAPEPLPVTDNLMGNRKTRRSIFSAIRDLNLTMYPDRNYRKQLSDETKKWAKLLGNALEVTGSRRSSTPNVSTNQDISTAFKMKAYLDERPDLEQFMAENKRFYKRAEAHLTNDDTIHRFNEISDIKRKLILEISNDVRDEILYDC